MKLNLSLAVTALSALLFPPVVAAADLQVDIKGLKNKKGQILVGMFDDEKKFPNKEAEFRGLVIKPGDKKASVVFKDVPEGVYAVAIIHDENMDGKLGKNTLGIPNEGYAFSNNAKGVFGPPTFEEASFAMGSEDKKIEMKMRY